MSIRKLKPTSAGRRFQTVSTFEEITRLSLPDAAVELKPVPLRPWLATRSSVG